MLPELQETLDRAVDFHDTVLEVKGYIEVNEIVDQAHILYFLLMGMLWKATERNESLTDEDAECFLAIEPGTLTGVSGLPIIPEMSAIPLREYLDYLNETYFGK